VQHVLLLLLLLVMLLQRPKVSCKGIWARPPACSSAATAKATAVHAKL
jgi:hypothetical protein